MAINLGSTPISGIYIGGTPISRAYVGSTLVYQAASVAESFFASAGASTVSAAWLSIAASGFTASGTCNLLPFTAVPRPDALPAATFLLDEAVATFDDPTGWQLDTDITISGGQAIKAAGTGNQDLEIDIAGITTGQSFVAYMEAQMSSGVVTPRLSTPSAVVGEGSVGNTSGATRSLFMPLLSTDAHTGLVARFNSASVGFLEKFNLMNLTSKLAGSLHIYILAGQSNILGASAVTDFNTYSDQEFRALMINGLENTAFGRITDNSGLSYDSDLTTDHGVGTPIPMADPIGGSGANNVGISPAVAIAKAICDGGVPAGVTPVFVCAGWGGTQLDLEWNPDSVATNGGVAWDLMIAQIDYLMGLNGSNEVRGMFWCQGESGRSADPSFYAPAFNSRVDLLRSTYSTTMPTVIMEIGGSLPDTNTEAMIAEQQKLATGSGNASELALCSYVARPAGAALEDGTHFTPSVNVQRGQEAAEAMLQLLYPGTEGGAVVSEATRYSYTNSLDDYQDFGAGNGADDDTRASVWVGRFASTDAVAYEQSGEFGFASDWVTPPEWQLTYAGVTDPGTGSNTWTDADSVTHLAFTPDNFESQLYDPGVVGPSTLPGGESYVSALSAIIDAWIANGSTPDVIQIYEGLLDMGPFGTLPASNDATDWGDFLDRNDGTTSGTVNMTTWYDTLASTLAAAYPAITVEIIPVARTFVALMKSGTLSSTVPTDWFVDDAPHGNQNYYAIAGAIVYAQTYRRIPPAPSSWSDVGSVITSNWSAIAAQIWAELDLGTAPATWTAPTAVAGDGQATITVGSGQPTAPSAPSGVAGDGQATITEAA